jgi:hypothetical protein
VGIRHRIRHPNDFNGFSCAISAPKCRRSRALQEERSRKLTFKVESKDEVLFVAMGEKIYGVDKVYFNNLIISNPERAAKPHIHLPQSVPRPCPPQNRFHQGLFALLGGLREQPMVGNLRVAYTNVVPWKVTSGEKSSNGAASTTLIVSLLLG